MNKEVGPAGGPPGPAAPQGKAGLQEPAGRQGMRREAGPAGESGAPGPPQGPSASGDVTMPRSAPARRSVRGAFFLILSWSVFGTPAVSENLEISVSPRVDPISAVCQMIKAAASASDIPTGFLLRIIWQESRFKPDAVGPVTRSGAHALGIAQFMPATAAERRLNSPFDPGEALPKAAEFLHDLHAEFGNIGLAAAAYNAGAQRVRDWLAGRRPLPSETKAYVRIVTGREVGEWARSQFPQITDTRANDIPCIDIARLEAPSTTVRKIRESGAQPTAHHPTWAAQLIGEESELNALNRYAQLKRKHPAILAGFEPTVLHNQIGRSSTAAWHRVRIVMETRQAADSLCARLQSSGEQCLVQRVYGDLEK
jgi:Transglycosylase SLT domain/SPOR domain